MEIKKRGFLLIFLLLAPMLYGGVVNGSFEESQQYTADNERIVSWEKAGWKLPEDLILPKYWGINPSTPNGTIEYLHKGGWKGSACVRLDGSAHIGAALTEKPLTGKPYIAKAKVKGKGTFVLGIYAYSEKGSRGWNLITRKVDSDRWVECRGIFPNENPEVKSISVFIYAAGPVDVDDVDFFAAELIDIMMTEETVNLAGTGALIEDLEIEAVQVDEGYKRHLSGYEESIEIFRNARLQIDKGLYESAEERIREKDAYVSGKNIKTVLAEHYNEMIVLTRVLRKLAGERAAEIAPVEVRPVEPVNIAYKPGERNIRKGTLTITDIHSDKVRYDESETATTEATLVNDSSEGFRGRLIAVMHLDLDISREIDRCDFAILPGETKKWKFSYDVGSETYGRGIEVTFENENGEVVDRWQEFYAVAAEWFRVQQHSHTHQGVVKNYHKVDPWITYYNQVHQFGSEPTDWGVHVDILAGIENYQAGQALYSGNNIPARKSNIIASQKLGQRITFYQHRGFCGQAGYEIIREHPEFALYDSSGQFAIDPVYGGYPSPMEIASPMEVGPNRRVTKPYLDRRVTYWQHGFADLAREDAMVFMAEGIKEYAKFFNLDGVYIDGNLGVIRGYGYDGKLNVPSDRPEDYAELNARNHYIFSKILKQDNPNFGTWYNSSVESMGFGGGHELRGAGLEWDTTGDASIRAAAGWKNVNFLMEIPPNLNPGSPSELSSPVNYLELLCKNRDYLAQKYRANVIVGYFFPKIPADTPGINKWSWATINYLGSQFLATQHHFGTQFYPSWRPIMQFLERYSCLIWAPYVEIVPDAEKIIKLESPEELWWKRLVYQRKTDKGYDLIIHLLRKPPYEKWDVDWIDEPIPLENVIISANIDDGNLQKVVTLRPYYYEEDQQPVEKIIKAVVREGVAVVHVPPFRYHTMIVMRVEK